MEELSFSKGDIAYYVREATEEIVKLKIRTVANDHVVGISDKGYSHLIFNKNFGVLLYKDRGYALEYLKNKL